MATEGQMDSALRLLARMVARAYLADTSKQLVAGEDRLTNDKEEENANQGDIGRNQTAKTG